MQAEEAFDDAPFVGVKVPLVSVIGTTGADLMEATSASAIASSEPPSLVPFSSSEETENDCALSKL